MIKAVILSKVLNPYRDKTDYLIFIDCWLKQLAFFTFRYQILIITIIYNIFEKKSNKVYFVLKRGPITNIKSNFTFTLSNEIWLGNRVFDAEFESIFYIC